MASTSTRREARASPDHRRVTGADPVSSGSDTLGDAIPASGRYISGLQLAIRMTAVGREPACRYIYATALRLIVPGIAHSKLFCTHGGAIIHIMKCTIATL